MISPSFLQKNDTIAIISTARSISEEEIFPAVNWLKNNDFQVVTGKTIGLKQHQFAGSETERVSELQKTLDNSDIKAIWCARGGYGTAQLLDKLDFSKFLKHPKWMLGYSDVTALHWHLQHLGVASLHCTMPINFLTNSAESLSFLKDFLLGKPFSYQWKNTQTKPQLIEGELVGGNLSVIYSLLGSPSKVDTHGKILLLEDLDEYLYHIDRMMLNLERNGLLSGLKAVLVGSFTKMHDNSIPFGLSAEEIIQKYCLPYGFPVIFNAPFGHTNHNLPFVLGKKIKISITNDQITTYF